MGVSAKQERSKLRVAKIIEAAHQILLTQNINDITIFSIVRVAFFSLLSVELILKQYSMI
mgnify:CR=1 FL=1